MDLNDVYRQMSDRAREQIRHNENISQQEQLNLHLSSINNSLQQQINQLKTEFDIYKQESELRAKSEHKKYIFSSILTIVGIICATIVGIIF